MSTPSQVMQTQIQRGYGIPRELYVDEELFAQEVDVIFGRSWLYACHESELATLGSYVTVESGDDSVIVSRTESGALAAFANVCRHRGSRLVDAGCAVTRRFVCPYHQWTYRTDGRLQGAPKMPAGFDSSAHGLSPVHVASWNGLVAVNLAKHAGPPLDGLMSLADPVLAPFELASARVAHTISYDVAANWKVVWENAQECYHCSANHPEFCRAVDPSPLGDTDWSDQQVRRSDDLRVQSTLFPLRSHAESLTIDGAPASARPLGEFARGRELYTAAVHLKPSFAVVACPDHAVVLAERPLDVGRTQVTMSWLVAADAEEGVDYDVDNLIKVWDHTNRQDWELCERTQAGIRSRFYEPGPLAADEGSVSGFHTAYATMLAAADL